MSAPGQPPAPRPRGSHRAAPKPRSVVVPVVLALAVVAGLGLAAWTLLSSDGENGAAPTSTPTVTDSGTSSDSPTTSKSPKPSKSPSKSPTASPTKTKTDQPTSQPVPAVGVYVFNQTSVTGLAASFARVLESQGWTVLGVDNWIGYVPENTVYYWPGDQAAAERLSRDFAEVARVWPASSPMPRDGLVVILATDPLK